MRLELIGVLIAVSPLHDKDLSDIEGQLYKKSTLSCDLCGEKNPVTADSVRVRIKRALGEKKCCYGSDSSEYRKHVFVSNA